MWAVFLFLSLVNIYNKNATDTNRLAQLPTLFKVRFSNMCSQSALDSFEHTWSAIVIWFGTHNWRVTRNLDSQSKCDGPILN